jgi:ABC-type antimicrobial peptide transport system permease subunit
LSGVYEVQYVESLIESINSNIQKISILLLGFAGILVLVVIILINNTVKLALYSQRFLIRSMQLVGATSFFIQRPFLNRAAFQGIISGIIASALLFGLMQYAYHEIDGTEPAQGRGANVHAHDRSDRAGLRDRVSELLPRRAQVPAPFTRRTILIWKKIKTSLPLAERTTSSCW